MQIITYDKQYHQQAVDLVLQIQNEENNLNLTLAEQPELQNIEDSFLSSGGNFWLALDKGIVVGTIGLLKETTTGAVLKKFFVAAPYRRHKVGLLLYNTLLKFCREHNIKQIVLDTPSIAVRSHQFYKQAGFVQITAEKLPFPYTYPDRHSLLFMFTLS